MRYFLNNNFENNEFELVSKDKYFVDKTEFIYQINQLICTKDRFICITRSRRFGKTVNAMMLASYYSKTANFKHLFDKLNISKCDSYFEHLNKHNVIYMTLNEMPKDFQLIMTEFLKKLYKYLDESEKKRYHF